MTREDIIRMAREAGSIDSDEVIETVFAAFSATERERIAAEWDGHMYGDTEDIDIGAAIRARGQQ